MPNHRMMCEPVGQAWEDAYTVKYEITVDAEGNWGVCEENGGEVIADLMTEENAIKICNLLNKEDE